MRVRGKGKFTVLVYIVCYDAISPNAVPSVSRNADGRVRQGRERRELILPSAFLGGRLHAFVYS